MTQRSGKLWLNGRLVPAAGAKVHVLTHGLHYGTGVFEGVRAYATDRGPAVFRLQDHTRRLLASARIVGMKIPHSFEKLCAAQLAVVAANRLRDAYIRPVAFYDDAGLGINVAAHKVMTVVAAFAFGAYLGKDGVEKGIDVGVSSFRRPDPAGTMVHAKVCGNYINSVLALAEARRNGYAEALLLDKDGYLSEGSGENIFLKLDGALVTPTTEASLNGITRQTVIEIAAEYGVEVVERRVARDEIYAAEEAFFTGTAAEVTPIASVDGVKVGSGRRGRLTKKLQQAYFDCVRGRHPLSEKHLTHVPRSRA